MINLLKRKSGIKFQYVSMVLIIICAISFNFTNIYAASSNEFEVTEESGGMPYVAINVADIFSGTSRDLDNILPGQSGSTTYKIVNNTNNDYRVIGLEMDKFISGIDPNALGNTGRDLATLEAYFWENCFYISLNGENTSNITTDSKFAITSLENEVSSDSYAAINKIFADYFANGIPANTTLELPIKYALAGSRTTNEFMSTSFNVGFKINLEAVTPIVNDFGYKVEYYKDSVSNSNLITSVDGVKHPLGTVLTKEIVSTDIGNGWIDNKKPSGYESGEVSTYPTIIDGNNVVQVVYKKSNFSYTVEYYKDELDISNNLLGTVNGSNKDYGTVLSESNVNSDLGSNWINEKKPEGYENGEVSSYPTIGSGSNVVKVLYKKSKIAYTVEYYKDNVDDTNNLLGKEQGKQQEFGLILDEDIVKSDLGSGWINAKKPESYLEGTVLSYPTIAIDPNTNVIKVLYTKNEVPYTVFYYKDDMINPKNLLGKTQGLAKSIGTLVDEEMVTSDLGENWINAKKPSGYKDGIVSKYPEITVDTSKNIIKVLYEVESKKTIEEPKELEKTPVVTEPISPLPLLENKTVSSEETPQVLVSPSGFTAKPSETEGNIYYIYDEDGTPLGYVKIPEGKTIDDIDIAAELIPLSKQNPKTMDNSSIELLLFGTLVLGFALKARKRIMFK